MIEPSQIAITGGTGHLGHSIILGLLEKGNSVVALYRKTQSQLEHPKLSWIKGNVLDPISIEQCIQNARIIIHSASLISVGNHDEKLVYDVNINGTKTIIKACLNKKIRLIYISSSTAVKESPNNTIFNENNPYKTQENFLYDYTKAHCEQLVLDAVHKTGLDALIIRPTAIVGPPDWRPSYFGQTIFDLMRTKTPFMVDGGYNIVDVRDVSQTIINSIDMGVSGEVYLVGGAYLQLKEIARIANPQRKFVLLSLNVCIALLPLIKMYERFFPLKWLVSKESLLTLKNAPKMVDSSKAINALNHQIRPVKTTVVELLTWFKKEK